MDGQNEIAIGPKAAQQPLGESKVGILRQFEQGYPSEIGGIDLDMVELFLKGVAGHLLPQCAAGREALALESADPPGVQLSRDKVQDFLLGERAELHGHAVKP